LGWTGGYRRRSVLSKPGARFGGLGGRRIGAREDGGYHAQKPGRHERADEIAPSRVRSMQGPDTGGGGWWRRELGSFLRLGVFALVVAAIVLLSPGEKAPAFLLAAFAAVAIPSGYLVWGLYRNYRAERSGGAGTPPEGPRTPE